MGNCILFANTSDVASLSNMSNLVGSSTISVTKSCTVSTFPAESVRYSLINFLPSVVLANPHTILPLTSSYLSSG
jgi:hypothetical protein